MLSQSFRPVREEWGEHSSMFVGTEIVQQVLEHVAMKVKSPFTYDDYGEFRVVWIEKGRDFLAYVASPKFDFSKVYWATKASNPDQKGLKALISNMKYMTTSWLTSVDSNGNLRFYLD